MQQLNQFIALMVSLAKENTLHVGVLRAQLLQAGLSEEEMTLLLEIVALEVKLHPQSHITQVGRIKAIKQYTAVEG